MRGRRAIIATSTGFHLRHLAVELARRGWDIRFHSYVPRWKTRQYGLADSQVTSHFAPLLPGSAAAFLRFGARWLLPLRERLAAAVDRRIARSAGATDLFIGLSSVAVASAQAARAAGALVLIERGASHIAQQEAAARAAGAAPPSALHSARELGSYAAADRIVVLSRYAWQSFVDHGIDPARLEVTTPGVDLEQFSPPPLPPPLPVRALMVGAWSRRKGCDLIAPLLARLPDLTITHIGTAGDAAMPRSARFTALGPCDQTRIAVAMRAHHLLLFPSRDDGFGMVMAEALACGMRVVASTASGGPDLAALVGDRFVTVFPAGSQDAFAAATRAQLAAIAAAPHALAAPAAARAALSWQAYGDRYARMVDRLLAARA